MGETVLRNYLRQIEKVYQAGNATEHSYRPNLKELVETFAPGITATNEPKRVKCGAPDFIVTRKQTPLGYIETKDIGISLNHTEHTHQMKRYLGSLANLILTDYVEFRWYVAGEHRMTACLAKAGMKGKWIPETDGIEQVSKLLQGFMITQTPTVNNPKELATRMASLAQLIRNAISLTFKSEEGGRSLHVQMEGFRQVLLPDLDSEQFADMYAQTICYGLFAARCNAKQNTPFTREHAAYDIPKTNPFLRKMFGYIAGPELDERIVWAVDDLAEVLNRSDMEVILRDFGKHTRQEDPVVHFYETFLAEYDPKMREARGVYYTPEPVVSYMVRSVDYLLKKDFGLVDGLADATILKAVSSDGNYSLETHKVQVLDPATGTGTFLHSVIDLIYETFKGNKGMWSSYVSQHLLPRLFAFELLVAPYAVAHMKLGLQLAETGYDFKSNERLRVYLTNTLEEGFEGGRLPFAEWLVEEATAAGYVKYDAPVMVVIGNPPYSGHSANKGSWITNLLHSKASNYFEVDGKPLGERNPKWLNDDYVKFIRFAQWRIERTGYGILAFITNHGYLDNPTFRGMRQSLMQSFDEIYVLDLHGNSKKKERSPDGSKDDNVFDIQQGVAIGLFVKHQKKIIPSRTATVYHSHLWGTREIYEKVGQEQRLVGGKYYWLAENDIHTTNWTTLISETPYYLFVPQDIDLRTEYEQGYRIPEIFPRTLLGPNSHRDDFAIAFTYDDAFLRIRDFANKLISDEILRQTYSLKDTRDWSLQKARKHNFGGVLPVKCIYRPFDFRYMLYGSYAFDYHRPEINDQLLQKNLALISTRQTKEQISLLVTNKPAGQHKLATPYDGSYLSPLYLYPESKKGTLIDTNEPSNAPGGRRPNLSSTFIINISNKLNMHFISDGKGDLQQTFGPEDIFNYMYGVFHSLTYRARYADFLKSDFPRIPLTSNADLFRELCRLGEQLVGLHVMEIFGKAVPNYPEQGNNLLEKIEYLEPCDQSEQGRIYINKTQYFESVSPDAWEFHIGGYQVCHRWLKDRKGRTLSFDDIKHYQRIVAAIAEMIYLMNKIDDAIEEHGGWPIE